MIAMAQTDESLTLDSLQRDILLPQIESFLAASPNAEARASYLALREAIDGLIIPAGLTGRLGAIVEVLLTSGRVRKLYGPGAELSLWALFQRTPQGRGINSSVEAVNAAFKRFSGQQIAGITAVARGPAAYALTVKTAQFQVVVRFEPTGIRLENVELGAG